jgi:hypothetical protein
MIIGKFNAIHTNNHRYYSKSAREWRKLHNIACALWCCWSSTTVSVWQSLLHTDCLSLLSLVHATAIIKKILCTIDRQSRERAETLHRRAQLTTAHRNRKRRQAKAHSKMAFVAVKAQSWSIVVCQSLSSVPLTDRNVSCSNRVVGCHRAVQSAKKFHEPYDLFSFSSQFKHVKIRQWIMQEQWK